MPFLTRPDGATIYYEVKGAGGVPVLLISPGGMGSSIEKWDMMPFNPWKQLPTDQFTLIGMDQRNAGKSSGPIGEGWDTYSQDQLALLEHLDIEKCISFGSCIGPSYQFNLLKHAPEKFIAAVMLQPIGLSTHTTEEEKWEGDNRKQTHLWFDMWATEKVELKNFTRNELDQLEAKMFSSDFVFSVSRDFVQNSVALPILLLKGQDVYHPSGTSVEVSKLAKNIEMYEDWKASEQIVEAGFQHVVAFMSQFRSKI